MEWVRTPSRYQLSLELVRLDVGGVTRDAVDRRRAVLELRYLLRLRPRRLARRLQLEDEFRPLALPLGLLRS